MSERQARPFPNPDAIARSVPRVAPCRLLEPTIFIARSGSITDAQARYGVGRSKIYRMIKDCPQVARRFYGATIIDFAVADEFFNRLPTSTELPTKRLPNLVNVGSNRPSRTVAAARAKRQAKNEAAEKSA